MDKYFNLFREMILLRGLSDHTLTGYCTYIRSYLEYLQNILKKNPEDVSWQELRDYIRWIQKERSLADRTINCAISQLRFFTIYVLHKPWDDSQLPKRRFNEYLPFVPTQEDLHSKNRMERYAPLSKYALDILTEYWFACGRPKGWLFPKQTDSSRSIDTFFLSRHIHEHEDRLGWPGRITCRSFRHALGTHLYENGTDLLTIKSILGHKSLNSTAIYVHSASSAFSGAVNPLDRMGGVSHD